MRRTPNFVGLWLSAAMALACSQPKEPLRVGVNPWPGYAFLYLAEEQGYFEAEGVPVHLVEFTSLEDARRAYERGHLDALGTTIVDVVQARQHQDRSLQVVRVVDYSTGGDVIALRPGLRRFADLRGKRVAVEPASLGAYLLARASEHMGIKVDEFEWVALGQVHMAAASRRVKWTRSSPTRRSRAGSRPWRERRSPSTRGRSPARSWMSSRWIAPWHSTGARTFAPYYAPLIGRQQPIGRIQQSTSPPWPGDRA